MRYTALLLLITIVMSFLTGKAFYTMTGDLESITLDRDELSSAMRNIEHRVKPDFTYDFNQVFAGRELFSGQSFFSDIMLQGSQLQQIDFSQVDSCQFRDKPVLIGFQAKQKYNLWFDFICGEVDRLPDSFFAQPPFVHPGGKSYAFLMVKSARFSSSNHWIIEHLKFFKLEELGAIAGHQKLPEPYHLLSTLSRDIVTYFLQQRSYFVAGDYLVLQPAKNLGSFFKNLWGEVERFTVRFYSLKKVNKYLDKTPYVISLREKKSKCLINQNNLCWRYSLRYYFSYASSTTIFVLILSLILLFVVVIIFWQKMREERQHEGNQRLALQILSHEFRTPISSLVVQNELVSKLREKLPPAVEELLMEMSVNIFRLQRLAEMSKNYLLASRSGKFNLQKREVENLNELLLSILDEFVDENIQLQDHTNKKVVILDPFWLQLALKNLVTNAIKYGKKPIVVQVEIIKRDLIISVVDQGVCNTSDLKKLTGEFQRGSDNDGMGLGLNIVKRAMEGVGGTLRFHTNPTTFELHFKKVVKDA